MATSERLSAAQRSKVRRLSEPKELAPDEEGGELNIVPFLDIIMNVLMFVLATVTVSFTAIIETNAPRLGGSASRPPQETQLGLQVIILNDGFWVNVMEQRVGEGCGATNTGLAVGKNDKGELDYAGLTKCLEKIEEVVIKQKFPALAEERKKCAEVNKHHPEPCFVTIIGNRDTPYQRIIHTIDAVRRRENGEFLFPDINFGVPR